MMFGYYIIKLGNDAIILNYLKHQKFGVLLQLIREVRKRGETK
jgi:hypothetical protein